MRKTLNYLENKNMNKKIKKDTPISKTASPTAKDQKGRFVAELGLSAIHANANTARMFSRSVFGEAGLADASQAMQAKADRVKAGDLSEVETALIAEAATLDAIFNELARRAALNMDNHLNATEIFMRLALKAQSQCRGTLQTLAEIKNPPAVAFVKQANIANGPQQINNTKSGFGGDAPTHAENSVNQANELLGANYGERLDIRATSTTGGFDKELATVEKINRAENRWRKGD